MNKEMIIRRRSKESYRESDEKGNTAITKITKCGNKERNELKKAKYNKEN